MGIGRSGTMLACYLVAVEQRTADDAIAETRKRRGRAIEISGQIEAIREFEKSLKNTT